MRRAVALAALAVASSCGGGAGAGDEVPTTSCGGAIDEPVSLSVRWTGHWGNGSMRSLFTEWDESEPNATLEVRDPGFYLDLAMALVDPAPPIVAQVTETAVPGLAAMGAITPMGDCLAGVGVDLAGVLPVAAAMAEVDGVRYGAPANLNAALLLYDRTAFTRAGLDPDEPPETIDELHAAGLALRERAGLEAPIAWSGGQVTVYDFDLDSDAARDVAERWARLGRDGLLYEPTDGETLPPIGSGRAAIQLVDLHDIWSYSSAIAEGQAPDADLAVAPRPGLERTATSLGGGVWVVSSSATPEQVAAAARFIAWITAPAQQVRLHRMDDLLPTEPAIAAGADLDTYWQELPLLRDAWEIVTEDPMPIRAWMEVAGAHVTAGRLLDDVARGGAPFLSTWEQLTELVARGAEAQAEDPERLLRCVAANVLQAGVPLDDCV